MKEKCTKFESLFLFRDEKELQEHLKECPDCRLEQEKMDKVSELIQEVKPYYAQKRRDSFSRLKIACVLCLGLFTGMSIGYFSKDNYITTANYSYSESSTTQSATINEYGMPIDNYGLISLN